MVSGKIKNIALVIPNFLLRDRFGDPSDPPLGIAYIGAVLLKEGFNVTLIDAYADNLNEDQVLSILKKNDVQFVGISCNYAPLHNPTLKLAKKIKEHFKNIFIAVGGNHATALSEYIIKSSDSIDFIIVGEGEYILKNLLIALNENISIEQVKGIIFKNREDNICFTGYQPLIPNLDELPLPAYDLLPMEKYKRYNIITSRGCPYQCSYCASNVIFNKRVRYRSPEKVICEINYLVDNFGDRQIWFSDDTFTSNKRYSESLLDAILKNYRKMKWSCLTRVNRIDLDLLIKMKKAGCDYISYGIETGSQKILKEIEKKITFEQITTTINNTSEAGIRAYGFFIVGFPGETWDDIYETYKLISKIDLDGAAFNILIPLPGTKIMNDLLTKKIIKIEDIKWDFLFARTLDNDYENYSATLAERWLSLSAKDLMDACVIGSKLPEIFRKIK